MVYNMVYQIYMINFDYYLQGLFVSIEDAIAKAKSTGFQYRIDEFNVESTGKVIFAGISKKQW